MRGGRRRDDSREDPDSGIYTDLDRRRHGLGNRRGRREVAVLLCQVVLRCILGYAG